MPPPAFADMQFEVGSWAERTFPQATDESIIAHLRREVTELLADCKREPAAKLAVGFEAADVLLLLMHLCHRRQIDLLDFAWTKYLANATRTWGTPDEEGVVEHVGE